MDWKKIERVEDKINVWKIAARQLGISDALLSTVEFIAKGLEETEKVKLAKTTINSKVYVTDRIEGYYLDYSVQFRDVVMLFCGYTAHHKDSHITSVNSLSDEEKKMIGELLLNLDFFNIYDKFLDNEELKDALNKFDWEGGYKTRESQRNEHINYDLFITNYNDFKVWCEQNITKEDKMGENASKADTLLTIEPTGTSVVTTPATDNNDLEKLQQQMQEQQKQIKVLQAQQQTTQNDVKELKTNFQKLMEAVNQIIAWFKKLIPGNKVEVKTVSTNPKIYPTLTDQG